MLVPLVLVLALHAKPNEAEKLFGDMEKKINSAKTLECAIELKLESSVEKQNFNAKGELALGEGNKSRFEMSGESGGKKGKSTEVADGVKLVILVTDKPKHTIEVPKTRNDWFRAKLARIGLTQMEVASGPGTPTPKEFNIDVIYGVSDFKLGKKEKVGDQEAQVIEYTLRFKPTETPMTVNVWLDTKTNLPLKRVVTATKDKEKTTFTETFSNFKVDEKIDPKKFELPKD
jgi:outer membrane lipoprotein-sorting protein